jgi:hypothetical protein
MRNQHRAILVVLNPFHRGVLDPNKASPYAPDTHAAPALDESSLRQPET